MWDFRNNLYLPLELLTNQQSPYAIQSVTSGTNALWLPMAFGFFLPLGFVTFNIASKIWLLLNISALVIIVWISTREKRPSPILLGIILLVICIFPSTISHMILGQISILVCLSMLLIIVYFQKLPDWALGILISFALIKPQLSVFFIPALFYVIYLLQGWKRVLSVLKWALFAIIISILPVFLYYPGWIPDFISNLSINPDWYHPSLVNLVPFLLKFGRPILSVGMIAFGIITTLFIIYINYQKMSEKLSLNRNYKIENSLIWILALTPIFSPYIWSWDFILIYPLMAFQVFKFKKPKNLFFMFAGYLIILILYIIQKLSGQDDDLFYWWVPWGLLAVTIIFNWIMNFKKIGSSRNEKRIGPN
ncbi:MAG: DUF2029 domain-containing protein [Chloroflexi bacterium]|nr:DUF2029 domain-containing protein [Chloroflexota bacterium]MBT3669228.1 DUF2029 domain-containing protein [Chloroflexota bacterium]MBT4003177.1 DUF2029 domain-containing protein [Chloroflexota bacterium]MBT4306472.1 DUF2029 domain-containing protein [Chloroflexota bacterium]MBT4534972.1 DUF2029 domain-containing protein [Chloroflexota bacterium]